MRLGEPGRRSTSKVQPEDLLGSSVFRLEWSIAMPDPDQEHTERRAALTGEYTAVVNNFRELTEIRFKLLNLLPLASLAAAALKPDPRSPGSLPFALFGLAATIAIAAYNKRNDQL